MSFFVTSGVCLDGFGRGASPESVMDGWPGFVGGNGPVFCDGVKEFRVFN